jgi:DNA repair protein RadC
MKQLLIIQEAKGSIKSPEDLFFKIKKININFSQENFLVICLNTKNQIISSEVLFKGGLDSCLIDPKIIFRYALLNNSNKIIIAHNHPSGNLSPSYEDKDVYNKLKSIGETLDLNVLDSIIFNEKEFYSLETGGLND